MSLSESEHPKAILVGQLPPGSPVTLSKTLEAVARVNFEKDTFHYVQSHRRAWVISNVVFATLCILLATIWMYREWTWMQERAQLQRRIYEGMIGGQNGLTPPGNSFR